MENTTPDVPHSTENHTPAGEMQSPSMPVRTRFVLAEIPPRPSSNCPICYDPFTIKATTQPCGHEFDSNCIEELLVDFSNAKAACPICREPVTSLKFRDETGTLVEEEIQYKW